MPISRKHEKLFYRSTLKNCGAKVWFEIPKMLIFVDTKKALFKNNIQPIFANSQENPTFSIGQLSGNYPLDLAL